MARAAKGSVHRHAMTMSGGSMDVTVGAPLLTAAFWRSSSLCRLPASPSCGSSVSSATSSPGSGIGCSPRSSSARAALRGNAVRRRGAPRPVLMATLLRKRQHRGYAFGRNILRSLFLRLCHADGGSLPARGQHRRDPDHLRPPTQSRQPSRPGELSTYQP